MQSLGLCGKAAPPTRKMNQISPAVYYKMIITPYTKDPQTPGTVMVAVPPEPSLKWKVSDSKVSREEGIVAGRCEGQVGTHFLV